MAMSDYARASPKNKYQISHSGVLSPGFLTPPSPYEGRRDSNASSQSTMSSFTSYTSDHSIPATPTYGPSPLGESFVDVMQYDLPMHGLPMQPQQKGLTPGESLHDWTMVHQNEQAMDQSISFHPHSGLLTASDFNSLLQVQSEHHNLNGPSWEHDSTIAWPGARHARRPSDSLAEQCWGNANQQSQDMFVPTMIPTDAMLIDNDYVHVESDPYDSSNSFEDVVGQSFPQSPQEVCFKTEDSVSAKLESDVEELERRPARRMYISPTGGKSVQKERLFREISKKRKKKAKKEQGYEVWNGEVRCVWDVGEVEMDPYTRKLRPINQDSNTKHQCDWTEVDGSRCMKIFKRQEHMKRHKRTHNGDQDHFCMICNRKFGRNDNCQDHYFTHVKKPGKKDGRNLKFSLREIEEIVICMSDGKGPKLVHKLRQKWLKEWPLPADCM